MMLKSQQKLTVKYIRYLLEILINLHSAVTMIKENNQLIVKKLMHMEQVKAKHIQSKKLDTTI